jgi:ABC-type glycerol-3-phosphate transport system substrate-binding protein
MEIQDRFNVNVDLTVVDDEAGGTHLEQDINNLVAAGDPAYDLVYNGDGPIARNAINGDFLNLRSMSSIDFAKPWFAGSSDVFTIGGKLFFTSNAFSISSIYMNDVLAINKDLAENLGLTVPYDKVRAGTWVMDDLIAMTDGVNQDLNGDGKMTEEDQYGFLTQYYSEMCIQSNLGGSMITKDENGRLAFSADQERVVSIVDQYAKLIENGNDTFGATNEGGAEVFGRGNSLFSYLEARIVYSKVRSYDVNFGILPFPKYNEDQQEYSAAGYDIYWAIPLTTLNTDVAGTVVCAMSCYNYNQIVPLVWEVILGGKLSDMPDDADMFRIMRDVQYVDLGYACSMMKSDLQELVFLLYYTKPGQVASALKKQERLANRVLENLNKTFDSLGE